MTVRSNSERACACSRHFVKPVAMREAQKDLEVLPDRALEALDRFARRRCRAASAPPPAGRRTSAARHSENARSGTAGSAGAETARARRFRGSQKILGLRIADDDQRCARWPGSACSATARRRTRSGRSSSAVRNRPHGSPSTAALSHRSPPVTEPEPNEIVARHLARLVDRQQAHHRHSVILDLPIANRGTRVDVIEHQRLQQERPVRADARRAMLGRQTTRTCRDRPNPTAPAPCRPRASHSQACRQCRPSPRSSQPAG